MFRSTTLRLTGWYLLILMSLSVIFSSVIYQVTCNEIDTRLEGFQESLQEEATEPAHALIMSEAYQNKELNAATSNLSVKLFYINLFALVGGGLGSYYLARRSLMPLEKAHKAQSRFTSDASHELRTPLAIMKTELEVALRDSNATTKSLKKVLSSNLEEVDKLSKLSEMLLNLSRLDSTKLKLGPVNLNKVALGIIKDFRQPADRISVNSGKRQIVHGNDIAIADLIRILVDNALHYSPKDSQISITITARGQLAKFEIANTGPGILPDNLPYIFDRFYRVDQSRTGGDQKGYGLGLALAKKIVDLHDGELIASSTPNRKTVFTALLPLHSNDKHGINT